MARQIALDKKKAVIIIVLIAAAIAAAVILLESEEDKIRKRFRELADLVEKQPDETKLVMAQKARKIGALATRPCTVSVPEYKAAGTYMPQEIARRMIMGRTRFIQLSLEFFDLSIDVLDDLNADAVLTARVEGLRLNNEPFEDTHEISCRLKKIDGQWLFNQVEVVDVLEK